MVISTKFCLLIGNGFWPSRALARSLRPVSGSLHGRRVTKVGRKSNTGFLGLRGALAAEKTAARRLGAEQEVRETHSARTPGLAALCRGLANSVRSRLLGDGLRDTGCALKAFRREVVDSFIRPHKSRKQRLSIAPLQAQEQGLGAEILRRGSSDPRAREAQTAGFVQPSAALLHTFPVWQRFFHAEIAADRWLHGQ